MDSGNKCRECGADIPASSRGFCAECLFGLGLRQVVSGESGQLSGEPGDRIGRYRLLAELGQGGCGVVYLAEQYEPLRRRVALKVIKRGMDTKQVVARFEAERQALALMDHPNIARVFDGGSIGDAESQLSSPTPQLFLGRPYFVMELVGGTPITDYCDRNNLTVRQRLHLFIQVCRAIQHAHQKGIIHRDIKPTNVLVVSHDGAPVPKVIDFGIAKATQGRLTDHTIFTAVEQFMGTPAYMSPEQAQLKGLDVDTRSDIYSLGVLLYELLTGVTPFDTKQLLAEGVEEMRRTIQEKEPPIPSNRVRQEEAARPIESSSKSGSKQKLEIDKDLDWIVMKCLEKDRGRRYETADGLARDIERHLENEPVVARPPRPLYSFRKAVKRNRAAFTSAAVVVLALVLGIFASTWQAVRARRAEHAKDFSLEQAEIAQANEAGERKKAETALAQMQAIEIRRAEEYHEAGDLHRMLPYLALVLRQNPENRLAAERLLSALSHNVWGRLACPPLTHSNRLTWAMLNKEGTQVLTSSADHTASIWDSATGRHLVGPLTHDAEVNNADFSPNGLFAVTASKDKTACIWDARTGVKLQTLNHRTNVLVSRYSPSGDLVLTVTERELLLWSVKSGQIYHALDTGQTNWDSVFNLDGTQVAVACLGGQAQLWDVASGLCLHKFQHTNEVRSVAFSPDGKLLVSGSHDNSAQVWDVQTGQPVGKPMMHAGPLRSAEFGPGGQRIVTASSDKTAQIWETGTAEKIGPPLKHNKEVGSVMFSSEGTRLVTSSETVCLWDTLTGAELTKPLAQESSAFFAEFHPDGERVLTVCNGKAALIWEIIGLPALTLFFSNVVESVEFSPDARAIAIASDGAHTRLWNPLTGEALTPPLSDAAARRITRTVFTFDGKRVATLAPDDGTVRIWNAADGKPITTNLMHGEGLAHVCFSPDGLRFLTGSPHQTRIWETATGKLLLTLAMGSLEDCPSFSADGEKFLALPEPRIAQVFSTRTGDPLTPPLTNTANITSAMFSPDGQSLLTTGAGEISFVIWDLKTGLRLGANFPHRDPVLNASYSRDGKRVLVPTIQYGAQVWDVEKAESLTGEFGRPNYLRNGILSGEGSRVVLTYNNGNVQLWDPDTGSRLSETLPSASGKNPIWTRSSTDGRFLAVSSREDKKVTIWEVPRADLPVPDWLPELAEALAGHRFNSQGKLVVVPPSELWALQQKMIALAASSTPATPYARWAKWFVASPSTRTVLPSSSLTLPQYVQTLLEQTTPQSWRQALLLQPTNAVAMARVGGSITNAGLADWMTRRAVELAPGSSEAWTERAAVLSRAGKVNESSNARARAKALKGKKN